MPDEQAEKAQRKKRSREVKPIRLQERDLDMFESLSTARYLSVPAIEWLHYPGWRERYKAYLEKRKTNPATVFYPAPHIYHRLVGMRSNQEPLVHRIARTNERATVTFSRLPDAYALAEAGAELLCARRGYDLDQLSYEDPRRRSIKNFEHSVAIGTCYAALRAALTFSGQQLSDWQNDRVLLGRDPERGGANYDRITVPGMKEQQPVLPDGTCTVAGVRYFVEQDMGTTNLRSWAEKIRTYEAYRRSPKLQARYSTDSFVVLVVAPNESRLRRIAEEVLKVVRQPTNSYLFVVEDRVHPTTIRAAWRHIEQFRWHRRQIVDRLVELPSDIVFAAHPLWKNP